MVGVEVQMQGLIYPGGVQAIDSFLDAGLLGSLDVEEAHDIKNRAYSMLDSFTG